MYVLRIRAVETDLVQRGRPDAREREIDLLRFELAHDRAADLLREIERRFRAVDLVGHAVLGSSSGSAWQDAAAALLARPRVTTISRRRAQMFSFVSNVPPLRPSFTLLRARPKTA